jgi:Mg-chelatase subunit ChlD
MLEDQKAELCFGLVAEDDAPADMSRHVLMQAGFGLFEASTALDHCKGDGQQAMELLTSGWKPPAPIAQSKQSSRPAVCPFSGAVAAAGGAGQSCPGPHAGGASGASSSGSASGQQAGRMLGDALQVELDSLLLEDAELVCPITLTLLLDPVIASDGCVYEQAAVAELARMQGVSPITHMALTGQVVAASEQQAKVGTFMRIRSEELLGFASRAKKQGKAVMALTALDRLKDYLAALTPEAEPDMTRRFVALCEELGRVVPSLSAPHERISKLLKEQVARAKAEGETVLQERGAGSGGQKSVLFCVDTSGSMRGPRIQKARENILSIFDQYIEDEDHVSLITFSHCLQTRFELQEVAVGKRSKLRMITDGACSEAGGGTAFWDALVSCVDGLKLSPPGNQQWIVALTDGMDQHSKRHDMLSAKAAIQAAAGSPDLIVIGIQLETHIKTNLEKLCEVTDKSIFIDASGNLTSLDEAFQQVAEMICD